MKKFSEDIFNEFLRLVKEVDDEFGQSSAIRYHLNELDKKLTALLKDQTRDNIKPAVIRLSAKDQVILQVLPKKIRDEMIEITSAKLAKAGAKIPDRFSQIKVLKIIAKAKPAQAELIGRWIFFWRL